MGDRIEKLLNSTIQHGTDNDRVYLMKVNSDDMPALVGEVHAFAQSSGYSKVFVKSSGEHAAAFIEGGFAVEAKVPGFYRGEVDAVYMAKYLTEERATEQSPDVVTGNLEIAQSKAGQFKDDGPGSFTLRVLGEDDAPEMAEVYKVVFETYPFPIHDPAYLRETMQTNIIYFGAFEGDKMVAISSAERDIDGLNAEMTDFATLPDYRGHGLAVKLLVEMEREMESQGYHVLHTIARSLSAGMNVTFAKLGYVFAGTLTNNTNICGKIESMNVWYKRLT